MELTQYLLSLLRIQQPDLLLPATTALATVYPRGRELGIEAGVNVVMTNLSPVGVRDKVKSIDRHLIHGYNLYHKSYNSYINNRFMCFWRGL